MDFLKTGKKPKTSMMEAKEAPGKKATLAIRDKLQVIRFAMDLMKAGRFKEQSVIAHFSPMLKQGMLGRWIARCKQDSWLEVPDAVWNAVPHPK